MTTLLKPINEEKNKFFFGGKSFQTFIVRCEENVTGDIHIVIA